VNGIQVLDDFAGKRATEEQPGRPGADDGNAEGNTFGDTQPGPGEHVVWKRVAAPATHDGDDEDGEQQHP